MHKSKNIDMRSLCHWHYTTPTHARITRVGTPCELMPYLLELLQNRLGVLWVCILRFTFSAFTGNFGLQVVHLHFKGLNIFPLLTTTSATPAKYNDANDYKQSYTTAHSNPNFNWNNLTFHLFKILKFSKNEI